MAVLESLRKSSINIQNISKTLSDTKKSTSSVNESVDNISRIVATNTRVKRELFARSDILSSRREEASKRQELEDRIESTRVSTSPQAGLSFSSRSEKGPLGRLLGFLGFITAGWIVENLPRWIFMGQEFISRIYSFGRSMYGMVNSMQIIIKSFGQTLGYSLNAIVRLDFDEFAGEGTVARSFEELNLSIKDLGTNITDTFKLFTTPLTESLETGEQAPALDEKRPDTMFPGVQQEPGVSSGNEVSGGRVSPQAVYSYLKSKGMTHIHALGITANIKGESDFEIGVSEKGNSKSGVGLFQYSNVRKPAFLKAVPDYKKNWKSQIDYALNEDRAPEYLKKQFSSPEEASVWWMNNWERPADWVKSGRNKKHNEFIKSFKPSSGQQQKPTVTPQTQTPPAQTSTPTTGKSFNPLPGGSFKGGERQRYLAPREGTRKHLGIDITESNWKAGSDPRIPVVAIRGGIVSQNNYVGGTKYDSGMVIDQDDGYSVRYLHMTPSVRPGQKVSAGQRIGRLVNLGIQTHLHIELYSGSKLLDPTNYIKTIEKGGVPPSIATRQPKTPSLSPAQISAQPKSSQPATITPERKGSQMLFIDATQPQAPQTSYPSQQQSSATPTISEFKLLNNFIKNKLLLDLAYL
jgi:murein DD-endopeptidase MepM/ murein hydrolase activator NlpD